MPHSFISLSTCAARGTGNHEEYTGEAAEWSEFVGERGFTVLTVRFRSPRGVSWEDAVALDYISGDVLACLGLSWHVIYLVRCVV